MGSDNEKENKTLKVIWLDKYVNQGENIEHGDKIKKIKQVEFIPTISIEDAISKVKSIKFFETIMIISRGFYKEFFPKFLQNIIDMYVVPKIIIFTSQGGKEEFKENFGNAIFEKRFNFFGGVVDEFDDVKKFISENLNNQKKFKGIKNENVILSKIKDKIIDFIVQRNKEEEKNQLTFEYIDCKEKLLLPLFYKALIEIPSDENIENYTKFLYTTFSSKKEIHDLIGQIRDIVGIPKELLSKYYARLYTIESDFYKELNKDLRENKNDRFLTFIKILYEGVKLKSLPISTSKKLYRGSKICNDELDKIKNSLKKRTPELPSVIVFSKSFLSFSENIEVAKFFLMPKNENQNLSKVLYTIEKDDKLDYSLYTHSDIQKISVFNEKEVLFFPFSSFEIKDIQEKTDNNEKIYEITLLYLGKYIKETEKDNLDENIPDDSQFKKQLVEVGLIPEVKMIKSKEIIEKYQEYKVEFDSIIDLNNEIEIIYDVKGQNEIRIFGNTFVNNNKDICKIVFGNNEYNLVEHFKIKDYTNENLTELHIKLRYIKNITDISCMFKYCKSLISIIDLYKLNLEEISSTSNMFFECSSLISLSDISIWNTDNIKDMSYMFHKCSSLTSLPDISKWNTKNVNNMANMFSRCKSLSSLPDISKWNTENVTNMESMFSWCESLSILPDISKWNTKNVTNMANLFNGCKSLSSLPDISQWNIDNVTNMSDIFKNCHKDLNIPSKFNK